MSFYLTLALLAVLPALANPYPDKNLVPKDSNTEQSSRKIDVDLLPATLAHEALMALRVQIDWNSETNQYSYGGLTKEPSATSALSRRAKRPDTLGSFKAQLTELGAGQAPFAFDAIGTGAEFKYLTRALTFRFPDMNQKALFEMFAENPISGRQEKVFEKIIDPNEARVLPPLDPKFLKVKRIKAATMKPELVINVYAEGYKNSAKFWRDAAKVVDALDSSKFTKFAQMEIRAVFYPSKLALGEAKDLGLPVSERDSYLGLYYPYWRNFGRWYHVVYPTREARYRDGIGQLAYDYPIVLIDSDAYWGVGNYKELTAIPGGSTSFTYLLLHEFGHFFGLNEEYEGGGRTELEFAAGIQEPWSQNITFLREPGHAALKWHQFVSESTPLPTPRTLWTSQVLGAYQGGYADSEPTHTSHKPGLRCVMERYSDFCAVCTHGINEVLRHDIAE